MHDFILVVADNIKLTGDTKFPNLLLVKLFLKRQMISDITHSPHAGMQACTVFTTHAVVQSLDKVIRQPVIILKGVV